MVQCNLWLFLMDDKLLVEETIILFHNRVGDNKMATFLLFLVSLVLIYLFLS